MYRVQAFIFKETFFDSWNLLPLLRVLFISLHRYDDGNFYPVGSESNFNYVGGNKAKGSWQIEYEFGCSLAVLFYIWYYSFWIKVLR